MLVERDSLALLSAHAFDVRPQCAIHRDIGMAPEVDTAAWVLQKVWQYVLLQVRARPQVDVVETKPCRDVGLG